MLSRKTNNQPSGGFHMKRKFALCVLTLAVALPLFTTPVKASKPTTQVFPVDEVLIDPCTGEQVHLTGTFTLSSASDVHNDIVHFREHDVIDLTGVGLTSGNSYSLRAVENVEDNFHLPFPFAPSEENVVTREQLISQGGADNLLFKETIHMTVNDNGDVTVQRIDFSTEWVG